VFNRRFVDFKILEPVAEFILNPFSGHVETKANEIGNLFELDKTILELEILTLQNDSVLKMYSKIPESTRYCSSYNFIFWFNLAM